MFLYKYVGEENYFLVRYVGEENYFLVRYVGGAKLVAGGGVGPSVTGRVPTLP